MADNERLLEAARMIQEHCNHTEQGGVCPFAHGGVCDGFKRCGIAPREFIPGEDWDIPKLCRWTPADKALAAGLKANGYNSVTRAIVGGVIALGRSKQALVLGDDMFASVAEGEIVNLDDIIGEG